MKRFEHDEQTGRFRECDCGDLVRYDDARAVIDGLQALLNERDAELDRLKAPLSNEAVRWVVNSLGELGVLLRGQAFFLYKGRSLQYAGPDDGEGGAPLLYRPVGKREFGECCHPLNARDPYRQGEVSVDDGNDWAPVPLRAVLK